MTLALPLAGAGTCTAVSAVTTAPLTVVTVHLVVVVLPLATIDGLTGRLPRSQVRATYPSTLAVAVACAIWTSPGTLVNAGLGAASLWALFLLLACFGQLGAGDVRLAPVLGAHLGCAGMLSVVVGTAAAFVLGALVTAALAATRRLGPDRRVPFGPALLGGALAALLTV